MVAPLGFEPRQTESESVVLPLHYRAIKNGASRRTLTLISSLGRSGPIHLDDRGYIKVSI